MINRLNLRLFFILLAVSCLVSGNLSLGLQDTNLQNTTIFNLTQYSNKTDVQPTSVLPQITTIRQEHSSPAPTSGQNILKTSQPSQENGTFGMLHNVENLKTNSTKHQSAGNGSLTGNKNPPQTPLPEIKHSLDHVTPSFTSRLSSLLGGNRINATNTVTTDHMVLDERFTSIPTVTVVKTTLNHQPNSTQKTATKVCITAEPKGENLVGRCLLAIGSLAAITIIFIMTTIILATKLAGSRHRHRVSLHHETEMVCISTLMNDSDHPIPTPRRPKSNGALIPITEDEDGDDLTLNSFLHDTDGVA